LWPPLAAAHLPETHDATLLMVPISPAFGDIDAHRNPVKKP